MTWPTRTAVALVRGWTAIYTWRIATPAATDRRAELESDVWELVNDADGGRGLTLPGQVLLRLVTGMADDLRWRLDEASEVERATVRRTVAFAVAAVVIAGVLAAPVAWAGRTTGGRSQALACAEAEGTPHSTPELRLRIMHCAGAFFAAR